MTEKTVAQMRAELRDFYFQKIKPNLETINRNRRISRLDAISVFCILGGGAWCMGFGILKIDGAENLSLAGFILVVFGVYCSIIAFRHEETSYSCGMFNAFMLTSRRIYFSTYSTNAGKVASFVTLTILLYVFYIIANPPAWLPQAISSWTMIFQR